MVINIMVPKKETTPFSVKDKMSALSHLIGFIISVLLSPLLLIKGAMDQKSLSDLVALAVFSFSMVILYAASTCYHSFHLDTEKKNLKLKKFDHMMIPVLIAGTYTPLCVTTLSNDGGVVLLDSIWFLSLLSIIFKAYWVTCPKFISSIIYIALGWTCGPYLGHLYFLLTPSGFRFLLLGGIAYTIGGVIYSTKLPILEKNKEFRSHELFHIFILIGSLFHYLMIYFFVA